MSMKLDADLQSFLDQKLSTGEFKSQDEVVVSALRLMQEQEQLNAEDLEELRLMIQVGVDEIARGEGAPFVPGQASEEGRRLLQQIKQKSA